MFFDTLCVNTKLKLSVPSAGLEMPSIFCSTQGPTATLVVELPEPADRQGQPKLICGRCTLRPKKCRLADSVAMTTAARARRNTSPSRTRHTTPFRHNGLHH